MIMSFTIQITHTVCHLYSYFIIYLIMHSNLVFLSVQKIMAKEDFFCTSSTVRTDVENSLKILLSKCPHDLPYFSITVIR